MIDSYGKHILRIIKQKVEQGLFTIRMNEIVPLTDARLDP